MACHCNDWHKPWIGMRKANQWLEESLCETASLFALRSMSRSWRTKPPYPNWKDYAPALADYADGRIQAAQRLLSNSPSFGNWFRDNEPSLRQNATLREKNTVIAIRLLPIFEANPAGWEAITYYNLGKARSRQIALRSIRRLDLRRACGAGRIHREVGSRLRPLTDQHDERCSFAGWRAIGAATPGSLAVRPEHYRPARSAMSRSRESDRKRSPEGPSRR
jgi:hypothetical protein